MCIKSESKSCWDTKVLVSWYEQVLVGFQAIGIFNHHQTANLQIYSKTQTPNETWIPWVVSCPPNQWAQWFFESWNANDHTSNAVQFAQIPSELIDRAALRGWILPRNWQPVVQEVEACFDGCLGSNMRGLAVASQACLGGSEEASSVGDFLPWWQQSPWQGKVCLFCYNW